MKKSLIILIMTTIIGALASFIFFPQQLAVSSFFGFLVGIIFFTETQIDYINKEIEQCREEIQDI